MLRVEIDPITARLLLWALAAAAVAGVLGLAVTQLDFSGTLTFVSAIVLSTIVALLARRDLAEHRD